MNIPSNIRKRIAFQIVCDNLNQSQSCWINWVGVDDSGIDCECVIHFYTCVMGY